MSTIEFIAGVIFWSFISVAIIIIAERRRH